MDDASEHAGPLRVISVGSLLLTALGAVALLLMPPPGPVTHDEVQAELFESVAEPLPDGLVADAASKLPTGDRVLVYRGDAEGGPVELTIVEYPVSRAKAVLKEQFADLRFDRGGEFGRGRGRGRGGRGGRGGGPHGGGDGKHGEGGDKPKLQDSGYFDWHEYKANYARLRHNLPTEKRAEHESEPQASAHAPDEESEAPAKTEPADDSGAEAHPDLEPEPETGSDPEGAKKPKATPFYETMRANLSVGGRCVIAYLRFPEGVEGTTEAMERVLDAFRPALETELTSGNDR